MQSLHLWEVWEKLIEFILQLIEFILPYQTEIFLQILMQVSFHKFCDFVLAKYENT